MANREPNDDSKTLAAEALSPMLKQFRLLSGKHLAGVSIVLEEGMATEVLMHFGPNALRIFANPDDDTLDIETVKWNQDVETVTQERMPWAMFMGKPFGWGWVAINQQGYCDSILFSFNDAYPQLALTVVASEIKISAVMRIDLPVRIVGSPE